MLSTEFLDCPQDKYHIGETASFRKLMLSTEKGQRLYLIKLLENCYTFNGLI